MAGMSPNPFRFLEAIERRRLFELDFFEVIPDEAFVEYHDDMRPDVRGWATPRRRPRRIAKKLARRGYRQRCAGDRSYPDELFVTYAVSSPCLRELLYEHGRDDQRPLIIAAPDRQLVGACLPDYAQPMVGRVRASTKEYRLERVEPSPAVVYSHTQTSSRVAAAPFEALPSVVDDDERWVVVRFSCGLSFPCVVLELRANIHMPLGVFNDGAARGSSEDEEAAKKMIETAAARLRYQLTAATRGRSWRGKTLAKHTSYRPFTTRTT